MVEMRKALLQNNWVLHWSLWDLRKYTTRADVNSEITKSEFYINYILPTQQKDAIGEDGKTLPLNHTNFFSVRSIVCWYPIYYIKSRVIWITQTLVKLGSIHIFKRTYKNTPPPRHPCAFLDGPKNAFRNRENPY